MSLAHIVDELIKRKEEAMNSTKQKLLDILMAVARPLNREGEHLSTGHAATAILKLIETEIVPEKHVAMEDEILDNISKGWNTCRQTMRDRLKEVEG